MGLFSTLQAAGGSTSSSARTGGNLSSCLEVPTIIQLFCGSEDVLFRGMDNPKTKNSSASVVQPWKLFQPCQVPSWAYLSYQTVQILESGATATTATTTSASTTTPSNPVNPTLSQVDLGIWNVRCNSTNATTDAVFLQIPNNTTTPCRKFSFVIDLDDVTLVEPNLTQMQEALVRYLIASSSSTQDNENNPAEQDKLHDNTLNQDSNETTSLFQLRNVQFGKAAQDVNPNLTPTDQDKKVSVALVICATLSNKRKSKHNRTNEPAKDTHAPVEEDEEEEDYHEKQARALIIYHLRKYAMLLNCSLCFVHTSPDAPPADIITVPNSESTHPNAHNNAAIFLNLNQMALLWRSFALGICIWKDYQDILEINTPQQTLSSNQEDQEQASLVVLTPLVFGPGSYQQDLLETVLLRNAQYPGHWDATTTDVWNIFPHQPRHTGPATTPNNKLGDQIWLTQLRDSLDVLLETTPGDEEMKTPEPKKNVKPKKTTPTTDSKADTAAFFESLLK